MQLLKFSFINGLELFILGLLLAFIILYVFYWLNDRRDRREYERSYAYLKFLVENSIVTLPAKKSIQQKFEDISKYRNCNHEKLAVLEAQFYKKFRI